jgi:hypothetical protein
MGIMLSSVTVYATILISPPYNWPSANIGLFTTPLIIASFFSILITGAGGDWIVKSLAKKTGRCLVSTSTDRS